MSGPSTYEPKTGVTRWLDARLPIIRFAHEHVLIVSDAAQSEHLVHVRRASWRSSSDCRSSPASCWRCTTRRMPTRAFNSVEHIMRDVNSGWLIRYLHANGASMFFLAVYIHMFRGLYYGSYKAPREIIWIIGVLLYALMILTAFLGYTLPWGQMSFWAATVITSLFSALPGVGEPIVQWLWGGFGVDNPTLNRFFSLHYLLPFILVGLVVLHIWALHVPGNNNPLGIDVKSPRDTVPFHPYYTVKDFFYLVCFLILFAYFVFFAPEDVEQPGQCRARQSDRDAARDRARMVLPAVLLDPALDPEQARRRARLVRCARRPRSSYRGWIRRKVRSARFRPVFKQFFWIFVADCLILGYVGANPVDATLLNTGIPLVWIGRIATFYYFAFFLVIMPLVGWLEKPNPLARQHRQLGA